MLALLVASGCQVANERADDRRADLQPGEIRPPSASEWVDGGVVLRAGNPGAWDVRLEGMLSPCAALERDGMYFLYYIGAAGDRSTDGGPRGRKLGVAFGPDPSRLSKYESNPVLSHAVGIPDCEECGVFSAAAWLGSDGSVTLLYGGMEERPRDNVDADVLLALSTDGLDFRPQGDVFRASDPRTLGDDEIYPLALFRGPGETWHSYYQAVGGGFQRALALASGPSASDFRGHELVRLAKGHYFAASVAEVSPSTILVAVQDGYGESGNLEWYRAPKDRPAGLEAIYQHPISGVDQSAVFLDRRNEQWLMYWLPTADPHEIRLRTAPLRRAGGKPS